MTEKSSFGKDDWKLLRDVAIFSATLLLCAGPHNPISAMHEVEAGKRALKTTTGTARPTR